MTAADDYSFQHYLESKQSVDDRALNRLVWERLLWELRRREGSKALRVLEIGAGIGTMFERLVNWGTVEFGHYTAIDLNPENILSARSRLTQWGQRHDWQVIREDWGLIFQRGEHILELRLRAVDLYDFLEVEKTIEGRWDLLVAHAFMDLVDVPRTLPDLFSLLEQGGLHYFTMNFDGLTILEPVIEASFDEKVISLYHRSMDERIVDGRPSGQSLTRRKLFNHLVCFGSDILASGASDWVVCPLHGRYPADEAHFLHFIIHTIQKELSGHPELDEGEFISWINKRHEQVERGELTYIAHQLDFLGRVRYVA